MSDRPRARDLNICIGRHPTGKWNAITDVPGVRVGHTTLISGEGRLKCGEGPVRTGVTAVLPAAGQIFHERVHGGAFVLNGAGEVSGLTQVVEWGIVETPILLTNTLAVGSVSEAVVHYMLENYPGIGQEHDVIIPLVGECDDSWLNDVAGGHIKREHVYAALDSAVGGPVAEGSVGGGTGMMTCDLKAGIGTSSRVLDEKEGSYTVGVLVQSNFGSLEELRVAGRMFGQFLAESAPEIRRRPGIAGSIIAIVGTDAPLLPHQLNRLAKRVALGIGRMGSYAAHGSGEIVLAFSTGNIVPRRPRRKVFRLKSLGDVWINPLYEATVNATEEAILNALLQADTMSGIQNRVATGLPIDLLMEFLES